MLLKTCLRNSAWVNVICLNRVCEKGPAVELKLGNCSYCCSDTYEESNRELQAQVQSFYKLKPQSNVREMQLIFIADALRSISGVNLGGNITVEGYNY